MKQSRAGQQSFKINPSHPSLAVQHAEVKPQVVQFPNTVGYETPRTTPRTASIKGNAMRPTSGQDIDMA